MKNKFIALVIAGIGALAGTNNANAQIASGSSSFEYQMNVAKTKNAGNETAMISPRAVKDFRNTYKNVKGENWTKIKEGFSVRFISDDVTTTIYYDKKGYRTASMKYYGEEKMLHELRHIVKSVYYDYNIAYVREVETTDSDGVPTYVVCVEDDTKIKMVRIYDGEMTEWKEYPKAK